MNAVSGRMTPRAHRDRWVPLAVPLIGTVPDAEIARIVGTTTRAVAYLRRTMLDEPKRPGRVVGLPPVSLIAYRMLVDAKHLLTIGEIAAAADCSDRRARSVMRDLERWGMARQAGMDNARAPLWEVV